MGDEIKEMNLSEMLFNRDERLLDYITNLQTIEQQYSAILSENAELENTIKCLNNQIDFYKRSNKIKESYLQLIADIGYDYDGMNTIDSLKGLIDELCEYALWGRDEYDFKPIYEKGGETYNILGEKLRGGDNNGK